MGIDTLARQPHRGDICVFAGAVAGSVNYVSMSQMYTRIPCNQHPVAIFRHVNTETHRDTEKCLMYRAVKYSTYIKIDGKHDPSKEMEGKRRTQERKRENESL